VSDPATLQAVAAALDNTVLVALDTETTGLDPRSDRVRLLSLAVDTIDGERFSYLLDCFAVDSAPLWEALAAKELVLHNAAFDLRFLARLGFTPAGAVHDTMLLARLLAAGTTDRCRLDDCCERYLGRTLDKAAQRSDWSSGELAADQLAYAAADVEVLVLLFHTLTEKIKAADLERVAGIDERALPAFLWLAGSGVAFDRQAWNALTREAEQAAKGLADQLDAAAPQRPGFLTREGAWDWNSPAQVKAVFGGAGINLESTDDDALAGLDHPLAALLRDYRATHKRVTTYGTDWSRHAAEDGRIYADWNQLGSVAGRTSCSSPNLQQAPRDPRYRRCFVAPPGRFLARADYSQLQLRIAAYPALASWHRRAGSSQARECRTLAGRRRLLDERTPYTHRLNTPVQGTEADGAKLALALLWERRGQCPGAFPVLFVHDEIVVECDQSQVEAAATWLKQAMLDGMGPLIEPVPVEVEVKVARTWAGD
jgi:DNA polymerase-1